MQQAYLLFQKQLAGYYPETEIRSFWLLLMEQLCGLSRTEIRTNKNNILSEEQGEKLKTIILRLQRAEPIQYILEECTFFDLPFFVSPSALIPRQETEELVDWILKENADCKGTVLDIGCGSGSIIVTLAKHCPLAKCYGLDISEDAIALAQKNAQRNQVAVSFIKGDILSKNCSPIPAQLIISNPPYVCEHEKASMHRNVLDYEPAVALFVPDNDPLIFYKAIADYAIENLLSGGKLFFEINRSYGKELTVMLEQKGFYAITVKKDISGNDRMIQAHKK